MKKESKAKTEYFGSTEIKFPFNHLRKAEAAHFFRATSARRVSSPPGRQKIAHRFNGGLTSQIKPSPAGTAENYMHTFTNSLFHCVRSTKGRQPVLTPAIQARLWPYIGGIARAHKISPLAIGGVVDHIHVLISLPPSLALSKAIQLLKGNSSKWLHEEFPELWSFSWQEGYGAFSISISGLENTKKYIAGQAEHHRQKTFLEEFKAFLEKHGHVYDEQELSK